MSTKCIIGRRLSPEWVQYGYGGVDGGFKYAGYHLLRYYNTPEAVDTLFQLGQLDWLGVPPESEAYNQPYLYNSWLFPWFSDGNNGSQPLGIPHYVGHSERELFSKLAFPDYGYLYDLDHRWYCITPSNPMVKMPLESLAGYHLRIKNEEEHVFKWHMDITVSIRQALQREWETDAGYVQYLKTAGYDAAAFQEALKNFSLWGASWDDETGEWVYNPSHDRDKKELLQEYFHEMILILPDNPEESLDGTVILQRASEPYVETLAYQQQHRADHAPDES